VWDRGFIVNRAAPLAMLPSLVLNHRASSTVRVFGVTRLQILQAQQVNPADAHQCAAAIR
jgi:hypothetical protein